MSLDSTNSILKLFDWQSYILFRQTDLFGESTEKVSFSFLGCCGYGTMGNSVRSEATKDAGPMQLYLYWPIPRRDCVIIPGLYASVNDKVVQFSDICGNAGLGGSASALNGRFRTGVFSGSAVTTNEKTLCSK